MKKKVHFELEDFIMKIKPDTFTYRMPKAMADAYLKSRTAEEKKMNQGDYLKEIINTQFALKGTCTKVHVI